MSKKRRRKWRLSENVIWIIKYFNIFFFFLRYSFVMLVRLFQSGESSHKRRKTKGEEKWNCKAQLTRQNWRLSHKFVISTLLFINFSQINTFVQAPWELFRSVSMLRSTHAICIDSFLSSWEAFGQLIYAFEISIRYQNEDFMKNGGEIPSAEALYNN